MARIEWSEELSVGVPEMDAQHQRWIGMINELHDTLLHGEADDLVGITGRLLREMAAYVDEHFRDEEAYMERTGFAGLDEHRRIHRRFSERVQRYLAEHESGLTLLNTTLMKELENWLFDHILNQDKQYGPQRG